MTIPAETSWHALADRVRAIDPHASHRVPLLERAERICRREERASTASCRALADRLERWRYQLLNERAGQMTPLDLRLADTLDLAANELAGRAARPPRAARAAVLDARGEAGLADEALACLDRATALDAVTRRAAQLTAAHFTPSGSVGRRMLMYAPLYLSSLCVNHCLYCGFRYPQQIVRRHLSADDARRQAEILVGRGFRHILLVAGDFPSLTTTGYFVQIVRALEDLGVRLAVEIAPQSTSSYAALMSAGVCGVTLYQETYDPQLYARYHPRGPKASLDWRLEGLERAAEAGARRLGLGILLGLADPRQELPALIRHARYLQERFPDRAIAFSLPRIHEAPAGFRVPHRVDDELFIRLYCALRVAFPAAELVLSTREQPELRDRLAAICITQISAGSSTVPGGYEDGADRSAGGQFPVCDHRTPDEVAEHLRRAGFDVRWDLP